LSEAKRLDYVSYEEMMEMSALGAGVLETRSVELAKNYDIPLYLDLMQLQLRLFFLIFLFLA
jgi:aspartate kinase